MQIIYFERNSQRIQALGRVDGVETPNAKAIQRGEDTIYFLPDSVDARDYFLGVLISDRRLMDPIDPEELDAINEALDEAVL